MRFICVDTCSDISAARPAGHVVLKARTSVGIPLACTIAPPQASPLAARVMCLGHVRALHHGRGRGTLVCVCVASFLAAE